MRRALVLALVLALPGVALAAKPPRPAAGTWKIGDKGHFKVGKSRKKISGLTMPSCNGTVKVLGKQKLTLTSRGGFTNWIIGKSTPKTSNGVTPIKVKVREAGKTVDGSLYLVFDVAGEKRDNSGALELPDCGFQDIEAQHG